MKSNTVVLLLIAVVLGLGILALEQGTFFSTPAESEQEWGDTSWGTTPEEEPEEEAVPHDDVTDRGYGGALEAARAADMNVLIFFTADWCSHCKRMKEDTLSKERVQKAMEKYVVYMCDTDKEGNIAKSFGVEGIPAYFIVDAEKSTVENSKVIKAGKGYRGPTTFLAWIETPAPGERDHRLPWR